MPSTSPLRNGNDSPNRQPNSAQRLPSHTRLGTPRSKSPDFDSPSRQIVEEFARLLVDNDRQRRTQLEHEIEEKKREHDAAIEYARIEHEKVREAALRKQQQLELEAERIRQAKEEDEIRALQQARQDKAEQEARTERARRDALKAQEDARQDAERRRKELADAEARAQEQEAKHTENLQRIDAEAKAKIEKEQQERSRAAERSLPSPPQSRPGDQQSATTATTTTTTAAAAASTTVSNGITPTTQTTSPLISTLAQRNAEHQKYLQLHQRLKEARSLVKSACRTAKRTQPNSPLCKIEEVRRELQKTFGQLTNPNTVTGKQTNLQIRQKVKSIIAQAQAIPEPTVNARDYILDPSQSTKQGNDQIPACFIYLLNIVAKQALTQWTESVSRNYPAAEPIGVLVAAIIASPEFAWNGLSFADIVLAKFHRSCPILFGIYGKESTENGRERMNWGRKESGAWMDELAHYDRVTSISAGWASLTLRNFSKAKNMRNAFPNWLYWRSVTGILNVPPSSLQPSHFACLKALLDQGYAKKFVELYGKVAVIVLRRAIVEVPESAPASAQKEGVRVLRESLKNPDVLGIQL